MKYRGVYLLLTGWAFTAFAAPWDNALTVTSAGVPCVNGQTPYYDKPECANLYEDIKNLTMVQIQSAINPLVNPSPSADSPASSMPLGCLKVPGCSTAPTGEPVQASEGSGVLLLGNGAAARQRNGNCQSPTPVPLSAPTCDIQAAPSEGWRSGLFTASSGYQTPAAQQQLALASKNRAQGSCGDWCELNVDVRKRQVCAHSVTDDDGHTTCERYRDEEYEAKLSFNESGTKCLREKSFFNGFMRRALINATADVLIEMKNSFPSNANTVALTLTPAPSPPAGASAVAPRCAMIAQNVLKLVAGLNEQEAALNQFLDDPVRHFTSIEKNNVRLRGCEDSSNNQTSTTNRGLVTTIVNSPASCGIKAARTPFATLMANLALCEIFERGNKSIGQIQLRMFGSNNGARDSLFDYVITRYQLNNGCRQDQIKALRGRNDAETNRIRKTRINDCYQETYGKALTELLNQAAPVRDIDASSQPNPLWFDNWTPPSPLVVPPFSCGNHL